MPTYFHFTSYIANKLMNNNEQQTINKKQNDHIILQLGWDN